MTIRTGSWDRFADHIRWSRPPAGPPQQTARPPSGVSPAQQAFAGQAASPRQPQQPAGQGAAGLSARGPKKPDQKGWLRRLLGRLGF